MKTRFTYRSSFIALGLSAAFVAPALSGCGDSSGPSGGGGEASADGSNGSGTGGGSSSRPEVPNSEDVRDDSGVSILDPAHPWFARLATAAISEPNSDVGNQNEAGTFRIKCDFSHALYDDPIVFPGEKSRAHLHAFFGNHTADADSTEESLLAKGETSCQGNELNRSSYWVPMVLAPVWNGDEAVMDDEGKRAYAAQLTIDSIGADNAGPDVYYKRLTAGQVVPMPAGLRMIVGSPTAVEPQMWENMHFACESSVHSDSPEFHKNIPVCDVGDKLNVDMWFPNCWDGVNLDSPDHKSHMAYPGPDGQGSGADYVCPASHPVPLPQVSYHFKYLVTAENGGPTGSTRGWKLSSDIYDVPDDSDHGGYSIHADWYMAWHPEAAALFTQHCINEGRHCANGDLGNGYRLADMAKGPQTVPAVINRGLGTWHAGH